MDVRTDCHVGVPVIVPERLRCIDVSSGNVVEVGGGRGWRKEWREMKTGTMGNDQRVFGFQATTRDEGILS